MYNKEQLKEIIVEVLAEGPASKSKLAFLCGFSSGNSIRIFTPILSELLSEGVVEPDGRYNFRLKESA